MRGRGKRCCGVLTCLLLSGCVGHAPSAHQQGAKAEEAAAVASSAAGKSREAESTPYAKTRGTELPADACVRTEEGAWAFLNQFVRSAPIRKQYTSADAIRAGLDPAQFGVGNVDNRWVYVDPTLDVADYPRVDLKLVVTGSKFNLEYTKARFSGDEESIEPYGGTGRYTFEFTGRCWELVAQAPMR